MNPNQYQSQRDLMSRLARRDGWSSKKFEDLYAEFAERARAEQQGQSPAYQLCRGECWMWKVHFRQHGPFRGIEPTRNSSIAPHIYSGGSYDRYTPQMGIRSRSRSPRPHARRSSLGLVGDARGDSWAQMAMKLSYPAAMNSKLGLNASVEKNTASSSVFLPSTQSTALDFDIASRGSRLRHSIAADNKKIRDTRIFFPPQPNGYPRYSHILTQRNALPAFIGPKSSPNIKYLEKHYPRLHFRKAHVEQGLLIWVEMPMEMKEDGYKLSRFDQGMLESADALLGCFAGLKSDILPNIDVFVKRYCDGAYDT